MKKLALFAVLLAFTVTSPAFSKGKRDSGPDLAWSCTTVRWAAAVFSQKQLEDMGKARGIVLTPKQRRQAQECMRNPGKA